jgi:hypothetical protein
MTAGWVAGTVRSHAMARRRLGVAAARQVAACPSIAAALVALTSSPYRRELVAAASLADAQDALAATVLWDMRVLAGWLPADGVRMLRALAGWFEIANVDRWLVAWSGGPASRPYRLGMLATAWPRLAVAGSPGELRTALATSAWGDPGGASAQQIRLGMRLNWADRVRARVPVAAGWALGAVGLLVARERLAQGRDLPPRAAVLAGRMLGPDCVAAGSVRELAAAAPGPVARLLRDIDAPGDLWQAELRWWSWLRVDAAGLVSRAGFGPGAAVGAVALLAADAWLVRAALAVAARGGRDMEAFDALA